MVDSALNAQQSGDHFPRGIYNTPQSGVGSTSYNKAYTAGGRIGTSIQDTKNAIKSAPAAVAAKRDAIRASAGGGIDTRTRSELRKAAPQSRPGQTSGVAPSTRPRMRVTGSQTTPKNWSEAAAAAKKMAVKGGPVLFWLVAGIAVVKDVIDIASVIIDAIGLALSATVVGSVVGVPLMVFSEIIDKASGLLIDFTLIAYFRYIGGGFALRMVIMSVGFIIDAIPYLDILPLTTLTFFAAYLFGRAVKKAAEIQSSPLARAVGRTMGVGRGAMRSVGRVAAMIK